MRGHRGPRFRRSAWVSKRIHPYFHVSIRLRESIASHPYVHRLATFSVAQRFAIMRGGSARNRAEFLDAPALSYEIPVRIPRQHHCGLFFVDHFRRDCDHVSLRLRGEQSLQRPVLPQARIELHQVVQRRM